jgi:hypothetical protein
MTSSLILLLVVVAAYLAAHVVSEWLARRFLIVSGAEYLLLGVLVGPSVGGIMTPARMEAFTPFMTLALGWIGALVGAQFRLPELLRLPARAFHIGFSEALLSFCVISGSSFLVLSLLGPFRGVDFLLPALALGAIGTSSAPFGIAVATRDLGRRAPLFRQLQVNTAADALIAVTAFGLLLAATNALVPADVRAPTPTEWAVLTAAIGLGGGALFHLFLGPESKNDRLFVALAGALILVSGAAAFLRLSPLLPAMLFGIVLVNTSASGDRIVEVLVGVERPLYFVLLIFAGALWRPSVGAGWWIVIAFVVVRVVSKIGAARLAARGKGKLDELGLDWGMGLLGHGGLAVAIGLNYLIQEGAPLRDLVFTATVASVLLTDVLSARVVRRLGPDDAGSRRGPGPEAPEPGPGGGA